MSDNLFKKILVSLDGSALAEQIMPFARQQAKCFGSKLVLIQVVPEPLVVSPGLPGATPAPVETADLLAEVEGVIAKAKDYLEQVAQPLRDAGLEVETVVASGTAGESVVDYARENQVDMIALATHGRSGLGRVVFGSVAEYILRESGLPVLSIKPVDERR